MTFLDLQRFLNSIILLFQKLRKTMCRMIIIITAIYYAWADIPTINVEKLRFQQGNVLLDSRILFESINLLQKLTICLYLRFEIFEKLKG